MLVYWVIFFVLAIGALLTVPHSKSGLMLIPLAFLPTAVMIGSRWEIGPDWPTYVEIWKSTAFYTFAQSVHHGDPGFMLLQWLLHLLGLPFAFENITCGVVFAAGLTAFCRRLPNPWIGFLLAFPYLVIVIAMSGNRQSLALGIFFFALNAFERRRLTAFIVLTLLAAFFHASVIVMLPIGLLSYTKNNLQRGVLVVIAILMALYLFTHTFEVYAHRYSSEHIQSTGVAFRLAMNALPAIIFLWNRQLFTLTDEQKTLWRNVSIASLLLVPLVFVVPSTTAVDRIILYLFPLQFLVFSHLPYLRREHEGSTKFFVISTILYAAMIQFVFLNFGKYAIAYVPYRSLLFS